jgi:hypothetical protein
MLKRKMQRSKSAGMFVTFLPARKTYISLDVQRLKFCKEYPVLAFRQKLGLGTERSGESILISISIIYVKSLAKRFFDISDFMA